jgi:hypothetical protein
MQAEYMGEIQKTLGNQVKGYVPEMERDVTGLEMIKKLAATMYGNGNGSVSVSGNGRK